MNKVWVSAKEYVGNNISYNDKRFLNLSSAIINGMRKEVNNLMPIIDDQVAINIYTKKLLENSSVFIRVLTTKERTHIYAVIIMQITDGDFTKRALTFPLTTLTEKSSKKDIFKVVKECKKLIEKLRERADYVYLETVLKDDTIIPHNKRILEWYNNKYGGVSKIYEVYVAKVYN